MPQIVEIRGLPSEAEAERRAEDFRIDDVPVEIIPQPDGTFTVRATYPDDVHIPGAVMSQPGSPAAGSPAAGSPAAGSPAAGSPAAGSPAAGSPAAGSPAAGSPAAGSPAAGSPAAGSPAGGGHVPTSPGRAAGTAGAKTLAPKGAALIKAFESCLSPVSGGFQAYRDPIDVLTIGWGHTNDNGRQFGPGDVWTQAECDAEFLKDMTIFVKAVNNLVTVPINQDQFDALVSFAFNVGAGNLKSSTLLRKVNVGDFAGAAQEFQRWNKAGGKVLRGLTRRRASEALLFQSIPDKNFDGVPD